MSGRFKGSPLAVHVRLSEIGAPHFERWLLLFRRTATDVCPEPAAALFISKAEMIARSLQLGVAVSRGELPPVPATAVARAAARSSRSGGFASTLSSISVPRSNTTPGRIGMLRLLMTPSNRLCDALGVTDEHERGLIRQLANALLLSALAIPSFWLVWHIAG
jgi:hypothetical protein